MTVSPKELNLKKEYDVALEEYVDKKLLDGDYSEVYHIVGIDATEDYPYSELLGKMPALREVYMKAGWRNMDVLSDGVHIWIRLMY